MHPAIFLSVRQYSMYDTIIALQKQLTSVVLFAGRFFPCSAMQRNKTFYGNPAYKSECKLES